MALLPYLKKKSHLVKADSLTILAAVRDPRTPFAAKAVAFLVLGYLFSPIDFVPDFIPILGWVDDIVIAGAGMFLLSKMIPPEVLFDARNNASAMEARVNKGKRIFKIIVIISFLIILVAIVALFLLIAYLIRQLLTAA